MPLVSIVIPVYKAEDQHRVDEALEVSIGLTTN